jgi:putative SOS response-associated peptidase YedK
MCNLYSMTRNREAILRLFRVSHNRAAIYEPRDAIFPGYQAPVVRKAADGEREPAVLNFRTVDGKGICPDSHYCCANFARAAPDDSLTFMERAKAHAMPKATRPQTAAGEPAMVLPAMISAIRRFSNSANAALT